MPETAHFQPNWASPPGDTVKELLRAMKMDTSTISKRAGLTNNQLRLLFSGSLKIDDNLAKSLSDIFGPSAEFWLTREAQYRTDIERLQAANPTQDSKSWIARLPIADMVKFGWITKRSMTGEKIGSALEFFGVESVAAWEAKFERTLSAVAFRTTDAFETNPYSVAAWLRQAQRLADGVNCEQWNPDRLWSELGSLRKLTRQKDPSIFLPQLTRILSKCGVALAVARAPKGCRASGATKFLDAETAMLAVSFRYLSDDHFWFTLFHEIGHLLLHGKEALFLEDGSNVTEQEEREANEFAANVLIPENLKNHLLEVRLQSKPFIRLAGQIGISPGVLVGQMQHRRMLEPQRLNGLKRRYTWNKIDPFFSTSK